MARPLLVVLLCLCLPSPLLALQGWKLDAKSLAQWQAMPNWLANPSSGASLQAVAEGLRFSVPEAGKGMKWRVPARWVNTQRFRFLVVRYRARGLDTRLSDYFIWLNDSSGRANESLYVLRLSDLSSDGKWHVAVADLQALDIRPYLLQLALQVQAMEPNCEVVVGEIAFSDSLPDGFQLPKRSLPPYRETPLPLTALERLQTQPGWLNNPSERAGLRVSQDGITVRVPEPNRGMKWSLSLSAPLSLRQTPYVLVEYRAVGIAPFRDYFLYTAPPDPTLPQSEYHAIWLDELVPDGKWRQLSVRLPEPAVDNLATLAFQVQAAEADAEVTIRSIRFVSYPPAPEKRLEQLLPAGGMRASSKGFMLLNLQASYNLNLRQVVSDPSVREFRFTNATFNAAGTPFRVSTGERNVAAVEGEVGVLSIPTGRVSATEAYFLLASSFPRYEEPAYGGGYLWRIRQPHRFVIELRYADGKRERVFPLRVLSRKHEVVQGLDVYVVPVTGQLVEVRLHDRMRLSEFGVCAVTLNTGKRRFDPRLWQVSLPSTSKLAVLRPSANPEVLQDANGITLQNPNLRVRVQTQPGGQLTELTLLPIHRNTLTKPVPLFRVKSWDGTQTVDSTDYRLAEQRLHEREVQMVWQPPNETFPKVILTFSIDERSALSIDVQLHNIAPTPQRWQFDIPAHWQLRIGEQDVYTYPLRTVIISDAPTDFHYRYGGSLPLQFLDLSNPSLGIGIGLLTKHLEGTDRFVDLQREGEITTLGIRWRGAPIAPGGSQTLPVEVFVHSGDGMATLERYKDWVKTWYRPLAPRKDWFRKVFAFRQDFIAEGLFDFATRTYRFAERLNLAKQAFGAVDYLHIFDWGTTADRGRVGDYDPWGNQLTTPSDFASAVRTLQSNGIPVGLYIEGYLVDERSHIGKAHKQDWGLRMRNGEVEPWAPGSPEFVMCPGVQAWRDYLTDVYRRAHAQTGALGFYIDEFGFTHRDCFADNHNHPPDWNVLRGEGTMTRQIREALPPECIVYTEYFPPDIHTTLQDGSFDYAINSFQLTAQRWMPVPLRLGRFVFPDFKVLQIIVCDYPTGSNEEAIKQVFFNGDGYWLQGDPDTWFTAESLATLRKCIAILRQYADAFCSDDCQPLVPTRMKGVFANRFSSRTTTVWTLYNANWHSVQGEVLAVPHQPGARYLDAWNGKALEPRIVGAQAYLQVAIEPHGVGCVVVKH